MKKKGLFVVVDGPSASGKDSIIRQVLKDLGELNIKAISIEETKEKGYSREKILLAKKKGEKQVAKTIIDERKKIYQEKVIPKLLTGTIILANRGEPTTLSYQTIQHDITMETIWNMHRNKNIPIPDLTVITNCSIEEAIRREDFRGLSNEEKDKNFMSGKFTKKDFEKRKYIHANYEKVKKFLEEKGLLVVYLNTDIMNVPQESEKIVEFIKNKYE